MRHLPVRRRRRRHHRRVQCHRIGLEDFLRFLVRLLCGVLPKGRSSNLVHFIHFKVDQDGSTSFDLTHTNESDRLIPVSKRLQVILKDPEYREIQRVARSRRMSIAEWVRQALDLARRREPGSAVGKKLEVIRAAARHDYPSADIDRMLAEIESGYGACTQP
jgi:hypothetical protein